MRSQVCYTNSQYEIPIANLEILFSAESLKEKPKNKKYILMPQTKLSFNHRNLFPNGTLTLIELEFHCFKSIITNSKYASDKLFKKTKTYKNGTKRTKLYTCITRWKIER